MAQTDVTEIVKQYAKQRKRPFYPSQKLSCLVLTQNTAPSRKRLSPAFDKVNAAEPDLLWELWAETDSWVEPVACGPTRSSAA